jgi:hypothetical protein
MKGRQELLRLQLAGPHSLGVRTHRNLHGHTGSRTLRSADPQTRKLLNFLGLQVHNTGPFAAQTCVRGGACARCVSPRAGIGAGQRA